MAHQRNIQTTYTSSFSSWRKTWKCTVSKPPLTTAPSSTSTTRLKNRFSLGSLKRPRFSQPRRQTFFHPRSQRGSCLRIMQLASRRLACQWLGNNQRSGTNSWLWPWVSQKTSLCHSCSQRPKLLKLLRLSLLMKTTVLRLRHKRQLQGLSDSPIQSNPTYYTWLLLTMTDTRQTN